MPYVKTGTKPSMLTKAKGYTKLVAPLAAAGTAGTIHGAIKAKQKSKKKIGGHMAKKRTFLQRSELQTVRPIKMVILRAALMLKFLRRFQLRIKLEANVEC